MSFHNYNNVESNCVGIDLEISVTILLILICGLFDKESAIFEFEQSSIYLFSSTTQVELHIKRCRQIYIVINVAPSRERTTSTHA